LKRLILRNWQLWALGARCALQAEPPQRGQVNVDFVQLVQSACAGCVEADFLSRRINALFSLD
jgi:hypothetical protein